MDATGHTLSPRIFCARSFVVRMRSQKVNKIWQLIIRPLLQQLCECEGYYTTSLQV